MMIMSNYNKILLNFIFFFVFLGGLILAVNLSCILEYKYIFIGAVMMMLGFTVSSFSLGLSLVVLFIANAISFYSVSYMGRNNLLFFLKIMYLFVFSMLIVLNSSSFIIFIVGWDGLGLTSYMLVAYYNNYISLNSGLLVLMVNRLSDVFMMVVLVLLFSGGCWGLNSCYLSGVYKFIIVFLFYMASIIKSAQLPFSFWLPLAMSAPTPVSSLVHSSTLVIAGVYLYFQLFEFMSSLVLVGVISVSSMTSLIFSLGVVYETDLKKNVAYTTIVQLGYMFIMLSFNLKLISFFHMVMHAFYKSGLFMMSGVYIYNNGDNQDLKMGLGLWNCYVSSALMIVYKVTSWGMPFLCSFYSKDMMLDYMFTSDSNMVVIMMFYLSLVFSVMGSTVLLFWMILVRKVILLSFNLQLSFMVFSPMIIFPMVFLLGGVLSWMVVEYECFLNHFVYKILSEQCMFWGVSAGVLVMLKNYMLMESYMFYSFTCMWGVKFLLVDFISKFLFVFSDLSGELNQFWLPQVSHSLGFKFWGGLSVYMSTMVFFMKINLGFIMLFYVFLC
uniref:NADH dehydrogenase subunit 5 n=1 Tax=Sacculina confragosa TaxID=238040 RepID=UPI002551D4D6|nr:NADH dehydrogenase subunit 5 [Sacculina confragosa]WGU20857.1 NADH dehydrogenase subunit 5 [Sacculina confragosa]